MSDARVGGVVVLSAGQLRVLEQLATGATHERVGEVLGVKVSTVRTHIRALQRKLGVRGGAGLVSAGIVAGLLTNDRWPVRLTGVRRFDPALLRTERARAGGDGSP
jgi:DNA-binding CsgD family transcriptional regulator